MIRTSGLVGYDGVVLMNGLTQTVKIAKSTITYTMPTGSAFRALDRDHAGDDL